MGIVVRIRGGKTRLTTLKHAHRGVVIGAGVYLVAVFGYCAYNYATTRAEVRKELDHRLMVGARATLLLADEHVSWPNPLEVTGESAYKAMLLRMNAYIEEANLDFIYTMAEEDGVIYFTASTFSEEDAEEKTSRPPSMWTRVQSSENASKAERSSSRTTPTAKVTIARRSYRRETRTAAIPGSGELQPDEATCSHEQLAAADAPSPT